MIEWKENENGINSKRFLEFTFLILGIFVIVAIPQWLLLSHFATDHMLYTMICFFISYPLLIVIFLVEPLEYARPWNYIVVITCYELLTIGVATFVLEWDFGYTIISVAAAIMLMTITLLICAPLIYYNMHPSPVKMATFSSMCFALVYCIMNMRLLKEWTFWVDFAVAVFLCSAVVRTMAHVLITKNRFEHLVVDDYLITAFKIYINFVLIFIGCAIAVDCIRVNYNLNLF